VEVCYSIYIFLLLKVSQLNQENEGYCYAQLSKAKIQEVRSRMPVEVKDTFAVSVILCFIYHFSSY
jgi:hypothetical protein